MNEILEHPNYLAVIDGLALKLDRPKSDVSAEAETYLKELYATHNPITEAIAAQSTQLIMSRGYDAAIDVDPAQVASIKTLSQNNAVAYVLTHKTYLDTFALSIALAKNKLPLPYTFGGINMSFMGLGQIGRQAGTIFIRRSFKGNAVYKAVFGYYIAHLVRQKAGFMWAIEGTRSRTGKLLWPKLGILKYIVDASRETNVKNVKYIPVSIVYDLIPDVKDMTAERTGTEKKAESLGWFMRYLARMMTRSFGKIHIRFGDPVVLDEASSAPEPEQLLERYSAAQVSLQKLAFDLVYSINSVTPATTSSLVCIALLSKFASTKLELERDVAALMQIVEHHKQGAAIELGQPIGTAVQKALKLLIEGEVIERKGMGLEARYAIAPTSYLMAVYYANMSIQTLVNHALIELALLRVAEKSAEKRLLQFWAEIMRLRDLFKFEFFYSQKPIFSDEIEAECKLFDPNWEAIIRDGSSADVLALLENQPLLVAQGILFPYIEAYRVVGHALQQHDGSEPFEQDAFVQAAMKLGEELHWQGRITRVDSVSRPFLLNGIHLAKNRDLIGETTEDRTAALAKHMRQLDDVADRLQKLQATTLARDTENIDAVVSAESLAILDPIGNVTREVLAGPTGAHIGAFFDLDRTLIEGFSAKEFFQHKLLSGQMTAKELTAQFAGVLVYAIGNRNFASLAAVGAKGVVGTKEETFLALGEEVYNKYLADEIYPQSRALVQAHLAQGHTVAIVTAATRYQVEPIARDMGFEHVMCTEMEVADGKFTGQIIDPPCWGEGKAYAARAMAEKHSLDLSESYFYTDSHEDMALLEIVGRPRPLNPDEELTRVSAENNWPIQRFRSGARPGLSNLVRTGLAFGSMVPAFLAGSASTLMGQDRREGANTMIAMLGDLGTRVAGIKLNVIGEENMWSHRPAVFIFNHQSGMDLLIGSKLLRKDVTAIAKQELKSSLVGPLLVAGGVVFIERGDREKAIAAMEPAVEALKNGTSVAIAPEGTRSKDHRLGQFKKGAFHLAMQAGVPLVPLVIKNAHNALPKGSLMIRAATIDVEVLAPIPTADWKKEDLDDHIKAIRQQFLTVLGQTE